MLIKKIIKEAGGFFYYNLFNRFFGKSGNKTLIYHAFGMDLRHDTYGISIPINDFDNHMSFIKANYETVPLNQSSTTNLTISITIDDGYEDTMYAAEILSKYNIPFTLFMTSDHINNKNFLSRDNLRELNNNKLCEVGSHGKTHSKLGSLSKSMQKSEILESKKVLEDLLGTSITSFSLPHGSFDSFTFPIIFESGYERVATSTKGFNSQKQKQIIKRSEIIKSDTTKSINKKILGYYDFYQL